MTIGPMLTQPEPVADLIERVLQEAGIEYVFGISGGHTGRIVSGLRKYQNSGPMGFAMTMNGLMTAIELDIRSLMW